MKRIVVLGGGFAGLETAIHLRKLEYDVTLVSDRDALLSRGHGSSDLPLTEAGFVKIDDSCLVEGLDNVYAVGDVANIEGPDWRAKQGHLAEVMARNVAFNIDAQERGSSRRRTYRHHLSILWVMDTGNGAAFVYRDDKRGVIIPLPIVGHWLKKAWGAYFKLSKLRKIPRIPGM